MMPMVPLPLDVVRASHLSVEWRIDSPAYDNDSLLWVGDIASRDWIALAGPNIRLDGTDIDRAPFLKDVEFIQTIQGGCIFNVSSADIKACWYLL